MLRFGYLGYVRPSLKIILVFERRDLCDSVEDEEGREAL